MGGHAESGERGGGAVELELLHRQPRGVADERGGIGADRRDAQRSAKAQESFDGTQRNLLDSSIVTQRAAGHCCECIPGGSVAARLR